LLRASLKFVFTVIFFATLIFGASDLFVAVAMREYGKA